MATNRKSGDNRRHGAIKNRTQVFNPVTNTWIKRNTDTGRLMDVKSDNKPFKSVTKEKINFTKTTKNEKLLHN